MASAIAFAIATTLPAVAATGAGEESELIAVIENADSTALGQTDNSSLSVQGYAAESAVQLPDEPGDPVHVGVDGFSLTTTPNLDLTVGADIASNAVAFLGDEVSQVVTDKGAGSAAIFTVIKTAEAPTEYIYPSTGADLIEIGESGGAFFYLGDKLVGVALAPWAEDANGVSVPTYYEVKEGELVQVVDHDEPGVAYPVVADPWYGESLISQINKYSGEPRLAVYTTSWYAAVQWNPAIPTQVADEFMRVVGSYYRTPGNKSQVWCHAFGPGTWKTPWNIEHWRPYYGDANMLATGCNPT